MISRQWRGLVKPGLADAFVHQLRSETFPEMRKITGFLGSSILRREVPEGSEFLIVTQWASLEVIHAFSGPNVETAVVPVEAKQMMIEYDHTVRHYEVVE